MPTYLCHGFRWQRKSVRVYVILHNIDDASPEWIIPAKSSQSILKSFYDVFEFLPYCSPKRGRYVAAREPDTDDDDGGSRILHRPNGASNERSQSRGRGRSQSQGTAQSRSLSRAKQQQPLPPLPLAIDDASSTASEDDFSAQDWSAIKLLEEYDPRDLSAVSRPYAYVADYAVRVDLSCSIVDEIARYEQLQLQSPYPAIAISPKKDPAERSSGWFEDLRDELQRGEEIRWYVVVNDDEVRDWPDEPAESARVPRQEAGYQPYQYQPYQQPQQQQQPYHYPSHYHTHPGRPTPSREQRQHHAQYMHQQRIFEIEDAAQKKEPEQEPEFTIQDPNRERNIERQKQQQQVISEKSNQGRKREQEQQQQILEWNDRERRREQDRQKEKEREKQREMEKEKERQRHQQQQRQQQQQQERERQKEKERQQQQQQQQQRQRDQKPPSYASDTRQPPTVPEKDFFHFPRPPTANANATANAIPLRPKISFDAGPGRPKTPGGKGGGLRRLFSRGKVDAGYSP